MSPDYLNRAHGEALDFARKNGLQDAMSVAALDALAGQFEAVMNSAYREVQSVPRSSET